jgi:hypothetical protein
MVFPEGRAVFALTLLISMTTDIDDIRSVIPKSLRPVILEAPSRPNRQIDHEIPSPEMV